jgi:predicted DNA-binding transcriptional regulator AlpA
MPASGHIAPQVLATLTGIAPSHIVTRQQGQTIHDWRKTVRAWHPSAGLYVLGASGVALYGGQTKNIYCRLLQHFRHKPFEEAWFTPAMGDLKAMERELLTQLQPAWNTQHVPLGKRVPSFVVPAASVNYVTVNELCDRWAISRATFYRKLRAGYLPKPVRFLGGLPRWPSDEIEEFERQARRDRGIAELSPASPPVSEG